MKPNNSSGQVFKCPSRDLNPEPHELPLCPCDPINNTQNYWVFGLFPTSYILKTKKHNVSETGFVSVLR
jgi:hypothetical protein